VRATDRNAEKKKPDLKTWTARCCPRAGQPALIYDSSEASKLLSSPAAFERIAGKINYERSELTEGKKGIRKECSLSGN